MDTPDEPTARQRWQRVRDLETPGRRVMLGQNASWKLADDPRHLLFTFARYKHAARLLPRRPGKAVLELGCGEGLGAFFLAEGAGRVLGVDFDAAALEAARAACDLPGVDFRRADFLGTAFGAFDGVVSLDVIEHIAPEAEEAFLQTLTANLAPGGVCVVGTPNATAQAHASQGSRIGHVNLYTGERLYESLTRHFANAFVFGINDETLHTGFLPMCHYLLAAACGPRRAA